MNIWGWVAIGVVVIALLLLAVIALGTVRRLPVLQRALKSTELKDDVVALQGEIAGLQSAAAEMQQRVQMTQERVAMVKASRSGS